MGNLCSNCFGGNILSPFRWVYFFVTECIEEVDDLSLPGCRVWYCGISDLYLILFVNGSISVDRVDYDLDCLDDTLY